MTPEEEYAEAQRIQAEINRLVVRINAEVVRQNQLYAELEYLETNIVILEQNAKVMSSEVNNYMSGLRDKLKKAEADVSDLFYALDDLVRVYTGFKSMSTASKNMTQYTDEYYTKFHFYNKLRRIALGYIIGLDANIISDETLRKQVEENYLQNTDYWLSYAAMAVMLWASDEQEAANRALNKAIHMDYFKSAVFFMLVNLRFGRIEAAKKWYLIYLDRVDVDNLSNEWQFLLQAYLSGVFGADAKFNALAKEGLSNLLLQMESTHPNYGNTITGYVLNFSNGYSYVTSNEYENLRRYCTNYEEMKDLLSSAEKNEVLTQYIREMWEQDEEVSEDYGERVEDILYDLINSYDDTELEIWKKIRFNEHVLRSRGDMQKAQAGYNAEFPDEGNKTTLADKLFQWAFEQNAAKVDFKVRRFSLDYLKKWIVKGFEQYYLSYKEKEKPLYHFKINDWEMDCNENSENDAVDSINKHFNKNYFRNIISDNYIIIFIVMTLVALLLIGITISRYNPVTLVIGILLGAVGGFLLWRRIVNLNQILYRKRDKAIAIIRSCLKELAAWRKNYNESSSKNKDLVAVFDSLSL